MCPAAAGAATIVVDQTGDLTGSFDDPGGCNLRDAVTAANTNAPFSDCPGDSGGGTGADTILLQGGLTYTLTNHKAPEDANAAGDLDIKGGGLTTIRSTGTGLATIDADSVNVPAQGATTRDRAIDVLEDSGGLTLERIRVVNGAVVNGQFGGGGIEAFEALTLIDSEVSGNSLGLFGGGSNFGGGGILLRRDASLTMTGSTVADNVAKANPATAADAALGGGISIFSTEPVAITNSTISGNRVDSAGNTTNKSLGGGIFWDGLTMRLTNVTISNNSAVNSAGAGTVGFAGGGLTLVSDGVTMGGTILAGNLAPVERDCGQGNSGVKETFVSAGDNVIGDASGCTRTGGSNDLSSVNAELAPLSNYGGLTRTQLPNAASPAIDHGGSCPALDQRGFVRAPVAPCDAGALEVGAVAAPDPVGTDPTGNDITFGRVTRNKKKGTAVLSVQVPSAGELDLAGKGLKPATATTAGAGSVSLTIKAAGKAKKKLRRKGKKTFDPAVTFTPTGGDPNTETTAVKLVRK